jgi:two-component system OmpR family response regulator
MSSRRSLKVLLIDDSPVVRRVLKRVLRSNSRVEHLFVAPNAADGYSLFKISRPDAVVLDLNLPDLHGLEILKKIKGRAPGCVVIVLTTCDDPEMREACLRYGADSFLRKESDLLSVASAITALCESALPGLRPGSTKGTNNKKGQEAR